MSIVIYVDGSHVYEHVNGKRFKTAKHAVGWGIVAHHNDQTIEIRGARTITEYPKGEHEYIAFIEALLYAKSHGFKYEEMSFYTDEKLLCDAEYMLHKGNCFNSATIERFQDKLKKVCTSFYTSDIYNQIIECIKNSRINWVKGHKDCVYNIRVDYLAKYAAQSLIYETMEPLLSFEEQFRKGIIKYQEDDTVSTWYPPFIKPSAIEELLGIAVPDSSSIMEEYVSEKNIFAITTEPTLD